MTFRDSCRTVRDKLPLHVGRDLDPKDERLVDAHLATCLPCFREYRALGEARAVLGVAAEERLPAGLLDGFTEEVMARIAVGEPGPAAELPGPARRTALQLLPALTAAAALLIVAVSAWQYFEGGRTVGRPDASELMRGSPPDLRAGDGPAASAPRGAPFFPSAPDEFAAGRFVVPRGALGQPLDVSGGAEVPSEAERQLDEALENAGVPYVIRFEGGKLLLDEPRDPRTRKR